MLQISNLHGKDMIMTVKELKQFFNEHLVPSKLYALRGGHHKNRICLGKTSDGWELYFSDKKQKIGLMHFKTENEACQKMKEEILKIMEQVYGMTWRNLA